MLATDGLKNMIIFTRQLMRYEVATAHITSLQDIVQEHLFIFCSVGYLNIVYSKMIRKLIALLAVSGFRNCRSAFKPNELELEWFSTSNHRASARRHLQRHCPYRKNRTHLEE
eukprot:GHVL01002702.1.p1 GENE.GHVL01002702.1~~GHVL01002702.1.p1  ORF type:complete len:113 (-),score=6.35 GHVL01002702.1:166-504(-)